LAALAVLLAGALGYVVSRSGPVRQKEIINKYAGVYKFDPLFILAIVRVESGFVHSARSHRGAVGLMQLMPETARDVARRFGIYVDEDSLGEPDLNIRLGCAYLHLLRREFKDDTVALLAAYNAGPTVVRSWRGRGVLPLDAVPYPETRAFVTKVQNTHRWLKRVQRVKNVVL
jgi:soluble lytic murein transglycosylase